MKESANQFEGYILAGGKSSRMGADKANLKIDGETFLARSIRTLAPVCNGRIKIILNRNQIAPESYESLYDIFPERGVLGGIHAALHDCETKYAIVLAVDLPLVTTEAMEKLADITLSSNKFIATVPRQTDGRLQPLCAVYHARYCLPTLENLLGENASASANDFLELIVPRIVDQNKLTVDKSPNIFFNVNRPADFQLLTSPTQ